MAKTSAAAKPNEAEAEAAPAEAAPAGVTLEKKPQAEGEAKAPTSRAVMITDPKTGERIKRADWIRQVFTDKDSEFYGNRGAIAKKLTELEGRIIPYQIVYAATKEFKVNRPAKVKAANSPAGALTNNGGGATEDPLAGAEGLSNTASE